MAVSRDAESAERFWFYPRPGSAGRGQGEGCLQSRPLTPTLSPQSRGEGAKPFALRSADSASRLTGYRFGATTTTSHSPHGVEPNSLPSSFRS